LHNFNIKRTKEAIIDKMKYIIQKSFMMKDKGIILHRQGAKSTLMTTVVLLFLDVPMVKVIEKEQGI